jgi:toxin ParE1/3/4
MNSWPTISPVLEVRFRPRAKADVAQIAAFTKAEWGEAQAQRYLLDMRGKIDLAAGFPGYGSAAFGLPPMYRKLRCGSHHIIYRFDDIILTIVRVIHQREDVPDDIEDYW